MPGKRLFDFVYLFVTQAFIFQYMVPPYGYPGYYPHEGVYGHPGFPMVRSTYV